MIRAGLGNIAELHLYQDVSSVELIADAAWLVRAGFDLIAVTASNGAVVLIISSA